MIGVEIVKDRESKIPDNELFNDIFENTKDHGLLMGKGGRFGNTFRVQPPMCITEEDVAFSLDVFEQSMKDALKNKK
jgi:4-aminobutyrate aminotransferase-like enzyme